MILRRTPALLMALCPLWASVTISAEEVTPVDPISAIDTKLSNKQAELDAMAKEYGLESDQLQQLKNEQTKLKRSGQDLDAKRNRAKAELDKQYTRLLDDPEIDLISFQKSYQQSWAEVKDNQALQLEQQQAITESEMRLSQIKQKQARLNAEQSYLTEQKVEARVKRLDAELRESQVVETQYQTTCSATMTLGECASQGKHLTKQKAVTAFRDSLMSSLTESTVAKRNAQGVELNIHVQESQFVRSGFEGNSNYFTHMQAQLQAKPDPVAACKLLDVASRYCLKGQPSETASTSNQQNPSWANVTVRSDQYNDEVVINGVDYGSTPVEVVLPRGRHQVTVSKQGYETYNRTITVTDGNTVWVKLRPSNDS